MPLPERMNNPAAARRYLDAFERRFVETREGIVYLPGETGEGVRVPRREAAAMLAGMRATLAEVDARQPLWGSDAFFLGAVLICVTLMIGAVTGRPRVAAGLVMPIVVGVVLLGPVLGNLRVWLAWRRGLEETERRLARFERMPADATRRIVPPNPVRPVFFVVATLGAAIAAGLMIASATAPRYGAVAIDRWLGPLVGWAAGLLIALSLLYKAVEAFVRPRVSEAEIALALRRRADLPLLEDEEEGLDPPPAVPARPTVRPVRAAYVPPSRYGRKPPN